MSGEAGTLCFQLGSADRLFIALHVGVFAIAHGLQIQHCKNSRVADFGRVNRLAQFHVKFLHQIGQRDIGPVPVFAFECRDIFGQQLVVIFGQPIDFAQQSAGRHGVAALRIGFQIVFERQFSRCQFAAVTGILYRIAIIVKSAGHRNVQFNAAQHIERGFFRPCGLAFGKRCKDLPRAGKITVIKRRCGQQIVGKVFAGLRCGSAQRRLNRRTHHRTVAAFGLQGLTRGRQHRALGGGQAFGRNQCYLKRCLPAAVADAAITIAVGVFILWRFLPQCHGKHTIIKRLRITAPVHRVIAGRMRHADITMPVGKQHQQIDPRIIAR